jgi:hypothetical protein
MKTQKKTYPLSYNKNLKRGSSQWAKEFNNWAQYIHEQNILLNSGAQMDTMLKLAKEVLA